MSVTVGNHECRSDISEALVLHQKAIIDQLDYLRAIKRLSEANMSHRTLARTLRVSQPTLQDALARASLESEPRPGFSGASPYEIAQRYAVEELSREQVTDELTRWKYASGANPTDGYDSLLVDSPGSLDEIVRAFDDGLLDDEIYATIIRNVAKRTSALN